MNDVSDSMDEIKCPLQVSGEIFKLPDSLVTLVLNIWFWPAKEKTMFEENRGILEYALYHYRAYMKSKKGLNQRN